MTTFRVQPSPPSLSISAPSFNSLFIYWRDCRAKMQYTYTNETQLHALRLRLRRYLECFAAGSLYAPRSINPNSMYNGVERHLWSWCHWEANFLSDQRSGQVQLVMLFVNQGMERSSWHATKHLKIFHWNGFLPDHDDETRKLLLCPKSWRIVDILDVCS